MRKFVDVALAERGGGRIEDVPTRRLDCLVDTGALMVLLPEDEVGKLGLSRGGRVIVTYLGDRREELPTARSWEEAPADMSIEEGTGALARGGLNLVAVLDCAALPAQTRDIMTSSGAPLARYRRLVLIGHCAGSAENGILPCRF